MPRLMSALALTALLGACAQMGASPAPARATDGGCCRPEPTAA
jgi:hypothetical protein